MNRVNDSLIISRRLRAGEMPDDIIAVCDLTSELTDPHSIRQTQGYRCHPLLDAGDGVADELIELAKQLPPTDEGPVLIHCANGYGRTGMFSAIWLLTHRFEETADNAIRTLQEARPGTRLRRRQRRTVEEACEILQRF